MDHVSVMLCIDLYETVLLLLEEPTKPHKTNEDKQRWCPQGPVLVGMATNDLSQTAETKRSHCTVSRKCTRTVQISDIDRPNLCAAGKTHLFFSESWIRINFSFLTALKSEYLRRVATIFTKFPKLTIKSLWKTNQLIWSINPVLMKHDYGSEKQTSSSSYSIIRPPSWPPPPLTLVTSHTSPLTFPYQPHPSSQ